VKPAPFHYHRPATLADALALLGTQPNARVLAGGQSLMPMLALRLATPEHLIDLNRLPELDFVRDEGDAIAFGAMTRQRTIEFSPLVAAKLPLMAEAIRWVGHRQTRNRGTLGGSVCHLDPSAEMPTVAMALDATLEVRSARGSRHVAMADFPAGYMTPALEPDELLVALRFPVWPGRVGTAFTEFARRHGDFAVVSVAAQVALDVRGAVARASVTLGGVAMAPVRVAAAEAALAGREATDAAIGAAADACAGIEANNDIHAPSWYRQRLARTLAGRALRAAVARAKGETQHG
jgi:carbon-monoxide dehydrogenase medium subunit